MPLERAEDRRDRQQAHGHHLVLDRPRDEAELGRILAELARSGPRPARGQPGSAARPAPQSGAAPSRSPETACRRCSPRGRAGLPRWRALVAPLPPPAVQILTQRAHLLQALLDASVGDRQFAGLREQAVELADGHPDALGRGPHGVGRGARSRWPDRGGRRGLEAAMSLSRGRQAQAGRRLAHGMGAGRRRAAAARSASTSDPAPGEAGTPSRLGDTLDRVDGAVDGVEPGSRRARRRLPRALQCRLDAVCKLARRPPARRLARHPSGCAPRGTGRPGSRRARGCAGCSSAPRSSLSSRSSSARTRSSSSAAEGRSELLPACGPDPIGDGSLAVLQLVLAGQVVEAAGHRRRDPRPPGGCRRSPPGSGSWPG